MSQRGRHLEARVSTIYLPRSLGQDIDTHLHVWKGAPRLQFLRLHSHRAPILSPLSRKERPKKA